MNVNDFIWRDISRYANINHFDDRQISDTIRYEIVWNNVKRPVQAVIRDRVWGLVFDQIVEELDPENAD